MSTCKKKDRESRLVPLHLLRRWQRGDKLKWLREAGDAFLVAHLSCTLVGFLNIVV